MKAEEEEKLLIKDLEWHDLDRHQERTVHIIIAYNLTTSGKTVRSVRTMAQEHDDTWDDLITAS